MALINVSFPGGVQVNANVAGFDVLTDQPEDNGGTNAAINPFYLFLSSLATCSGFFALRFCQQRDLPTAGLGLTLDAERDEETHALKKVCIKLQLPAEFPDKYKKAIVRATEQCSVKKALMHPPEIEMVTE